MYLYSVIYRSVSKYMYKQARSQEVRRGGGGGGESINTSESIYPGGQYESGVWGVYCGRVDVTGVA